jgi:hypothetical protein
MVEKVADLRPSTSGHDLVVKVIKSNRLVFESEGRGLEGVCTARASSNKQPRARHAASLPAAARIVCCETGSHQNDTQSQQTQQHQVVKAATVVERPKLTVVEAVVGDDSATIVLSAKNEHGARHAHAHSALRRGESGGNTIHAHTHTRITTSPPPQNNNNYQKQPSS